MYELVEAVWWLIKVISGAVALGWGICFVILLAADAASLIQGRRPEQILDFIDMWRK